MSYLNIVSLGIVIHTIFSEFHFLYVVRQNCIFLFSSYSSTLMFYFVAYPYLLETESLKEWISWWHRAGRTAWCFHWFSQPRQEVELWVLTACVIWSAYYLSLLQFTNCVTLSQLNSLFICKMALITSASQSCCNSYKINQVMYSEKWLEHSK